VQLEQLFAALAGDDKTAWDLTESAGDRVRSWQLLLVTTDPLSERARTALDSGVDIALKAGLAGPLLQRLVTALDALGEEVPIPLWDLAGKAPQPDDGYLPATGYELVNLYLTWNATKDIVFSASIDNLLNQYYRPYAIPGSSTDGTTQNDVLWSSPGPGRVYKAGLKIHFGGA